ncbi:CU044_2847 family protein [Actinoplanes sp. NEAU-A12]|uniref:CU044_2847 family protein n=1 Tax=Actinoplanes sandaracinus TaxID=3045177 RepID=A0ABT6WGH1_9ACTN|nr:CU044_2847 family protein [Actinoplanes sandaracinus]MDI6098812.1 CU044_2847 family protein [Actinoplanes sandaracinus]
MLLPAEINGVEVLVEVTKSAGSEPTSGFQRSAEKISDLLDRAQIVIEAIANSISETGQRIAQQASQANQIEIQFGLKFSAQGKIIIGASTAEGSLAVKMIFAQQPRTDSDESFEWHASNDGKGEQ